MTMRGALDGVRVLDASQMLAGPLCALRLGDLGADVLKIEPPGQGEWARTHGFANAELDGETTAFLALNRNKRSVAVNLKHPDGLEVLYDLARRSDVFIQNFRVGTAERLGVGYERLREVNPRLVYCSITGYGERGPHVARPGQDLVVQGYSGSMWAVGSDDDPPTPSALWAVDAMAAYQAAIGILAALHARAHTHEGQKVEVSLFGCVLDVQLQELVTFLNLGIAPRRSGEWSAHALLPAPYGVYRTADGWLTLAMAPLHVLGEALDDDRLRAMTAWSDGVDRRDEVIRIVREIMPTRTTPEWIELLDRHKLWAGPVYMYSDLAEDPHVRETGMLTSVRHPTIGELRMPAAPIGLSATPAAIDRPPPLLAEHTREILSDLLGYDDERLERLEAAGAVSTGRSVAV
jgi:crotonobetainyl-CoA:carnitine CoA-transferase CaiB-like acyl-CoA transferase